MLLGFVDHRSRLALCERQSIVVSNIYAILNRCWVWWWRLCKSLKYFHYWHLPRKVKGKRQRNFCNQFRLLLCTEVLFIIEQNLFIHIDIRHISRTNYLQLKASKFFSQCCRRSLRETLEKFEWSWFEIEIQDVICHLNKGWKFFSLKIIIF